MAAANGSATNRQRKGRFFKINLNQRREDGLEETVSLNESAFIHTAPIIEGMTTETRLRPPTGARSPQMATRELIGRTAVGNALKKTPSEPSGLTTLSNNDTGNRRENIKATPSPLENYAVLEEIGDSGYGKTYRIKRLSDNKPFSLKCIAHQMSRPGTDTSGVSEGDAQALAIMIRELLAQYRVNGHPNFLTMHDCWFTVYDLEDIPPTPSLGQPFDLNRFSVNRFRRKRTTMSDMNGEEEDDEEELVDFSLYGVRLLTALLKEQPLQKPRNNGPIAVVLYMVLDYCPYDLEDYLAPRHKSMQSTMVDPSLQWKFFMDLLRVLLVLYDCDLVHLNMQASSFGLTVLESEQLKPRLMDFGINRYFETCISRLRYSPLQTSLYQAPEVELAKREPDMVLSWASDVYSVALLMVSFCAGSRDTADAVIREVKAGKLQVLNNLEMPYDLREPLKAMLSLEADLRPSPWEILASVISNMDHHGDTFPEFPESSEMSDELRSRLSIEMEMLKSRLHYQSWLKQLPDSLWFGVIKSCAKEMLERYLEHLTHMDSEVDQTSSAEVSTTIIDVQCMLDCPNLDAELTKCVDNALRDNEQLLKAAVWYSWKKYGRLYQTRTDNEGTTWIKELEDLYTEIFENDDDFCVVSRC